jgi:hypothetical protein
LTAEEPNSSSFKDAGRYFKRWDKAVGRFVSNIKDIYPDD